MSEHAQEFGRLVLRRREELSLTHDQVADAGGPSDSTLTKIEADGGPAAVRSDTLRRLDVGLRWQPGSAKRAWESGAEPIPVDAPPPGLDSFTDLDLARELTRRLAEKSERSDGSGDAAPTSPAGRARDQVAQAGSTVARGSHVPSHDPVKYLPER